MKHTIKIQELSDGRFRNALTGRVGDSISEVVKVPVIDRKMIKSKKVKVTKEWEWSITQENNGKFAWWLYEGLNKKDGKWDFNSEDEAMKDLKKTAKAEWGVSIS